MNTKTIVKGLLVVVATTSVFLTAQPAEAQLVIQPTIVEPGPQYPVYAPVYPTAERRHFYNWDHWRGHNDWRSDHDDHRYNRR